MKKVLWETAVQMDVWETTVKKDMYLMVSVFHRYFVCFMIWIVVLSMFLSFRFVRLFLFPLCSYLPFFSWLLITFRGFGRSLKRPRFKAQGGATIKQLVANSRLNAPFMWWCIAFAQSVDFVAAPDQLMELVTCTFEGFLQSYINEKANKVIRDTECRANASKVVYYSTRSRVSTVDDDVLHSLAANHMSQAFPTRAHRSA